jgi:hypothetical protein
MFSFTLSGIPCICDNKIAIWKLMFNFQEKRFELKVAAKQTCAGEGVIDSIKNPS